MFIRNVVLWVIMIFGYVVYGMVEEVVELFKLIIWGEEERGNQFFLISVFSLLIFFELFGFGMVVYCFVVKVGVVWIEEFRNVFVIMYLKCGSFSDVFQMFLMFIDKNFIMWFVMVIGFVQSGYFKDVLELFYEMYCFGVRFNEYIFVGVINVCSDISVIKEGK